MSEKVRCTKDCYLYNHPSCFINPNAQKDKLKHREWCDSPLPTDAKNNGKDKASDGLMKFMSKLEKKENMRDISVGKKRIPLIIKHILQMDLNGNVIAEYNSAVEAGKAIGGNPTAIRAAARGKSKTSFGFKWKYK